MKIRKRLGAKIGDDTDSEVDKDSGNEDSGDNDQHFLGGTQMTNKRNQRYT